MKIKLVYTAMIAFVLASCTKDITEFNANPKAPEDVPASMLFANAQKDLVYYMASPNVNTNTFRLWSQQWTQTTYTDESNYELTERNINGGVFNDLYANVLRDLSEARGIIEEDELLNADDVAMQSAMIEVMEVYTYHVLVDIFNDVPYSEAIQLIDDLVPAYDDAATIYADLGARLDAAIATLSNGNGDAGDLADADLLMGGDGAAWEQFARALKLKLALRLADVNGSTAQTWAEGADIDLAAWSEPTLMFESSPPNTNPLWEDLVQSGRTDFIASSTLADLMNSTNDPRRGMYFRNLDSTGAVQGNPHGAGGSYANFSQPGDMLEDPALPHSLMTTAEVYFMMAEATLRGWNVSGSAASADYESGIRESIAAWGGSSIDADSFLVQSNVDYQAQADAGVDGLEIVATQKYVALYNHGFEAWSTWRLYDVPEMDVAAEAGTTPPLRYTYSVDEYSINGSNAEAANGGSDNVMDRVFWDVD